METIVKTFYENLGKKKMMGFKCNKCGTHSFPPKPTCNKCGSKDLKWVTMSGKGKLQIYNVVNYPGGEFQALAPYAYGLVMMEEGVPYFTMIKGVDIRDPWAGNLKLPIPVTASVEKIGTKTVVVFNAVK